MPKKNFCFKNKHKSTPKTRVGYAWLRHEKFRNSDSNPYCCSVQTVPQQPNSAPPKRYVSQA